MDGIPTRIWCLSHTDPYSYTPDLAHVHPTPIGIKVLGLEMARPHRFVILR